MKYFISFTFIEDEKNRYGNGVIKCKKITHFEDIRFVEKRIEKEYMLKKDTARILNFIKL